jgi:para-aminobenzoate synthetase component 1
MGKERTACLFILDYKLEHCIVRELATVDTQEIRFQLGQSFSNYPDMEWEVTDFRFERFPVEMEQYSKAFDAVQQEFRQGNTFLLNLSFPTRVDCDLSLEQMYDLSRARYKLYVKDDFVLFSPESFIRIEKNIISSFPMKGTIDATLPGAEEMILANEKELAEHTAIVDLIRNDLSRISSHVRVERFRYVEEVQALEKNLLQVSSEIRGDLEPGWQDTLGDMLASLLPAGSITGAPKAKTCEIIERVETYQRGFFSGVFGIFDGENVESAVMIRFIEQTDQGLMFKSGGGIMVYSDVGEEYKEMVDKVYVPIPGKH